MNLDKYEKIGAGKSLEVLEAGGSIFSEGKQEGVDEYRVIDWVLHSKLDQQAEFLRDHSDVIWFLQQDWYIKKPFDVRQAMLDRPNEWVGAYGQDERWMKVGFDAKRMRPVRSFMNSGAKVNLQDTRVFVIELADLDLCIPIEDVPKEANQ